MVLTAAALGLGASRLPWLGPWTADVVFLVLAAVTVVSALGAVTFHNPVYCAIWFGQSLLGTAGLFFVAGAQFLAVATVVIYAGAILVTFLFVLMLAQPKGRAAYDRVSWEAPIAAAAGVVMVAILSIAIGGISAAGGGRRARGPDCSADGSGVGRRRARPAARGPLRRRVVRAAPGRRRNRRDAAAGCAGGGGRDRSTQRVG